MTIWQGLSLAASSLLIVVAAPAQYFGRQHDDIINFIASQALSQGSYRLLTTPGLPFLTMTEPGFPLILLPLALVFGEWVPAFQAFCCLILAVSPWVVWRWLKDEVGARQACLIALVYGSSPLVLSQSGTVMPEAAYTVLAVLLAMTLARPRARPAGARSDSPMAGALLAALIQIRPAGLSLLPAVLLRPLRDRRWKDAAWMGGPALLGLGAWWAWTWSKSGGVQEAGEFAVSYAGRPASHLLAVAWDNGRFYLSSWGSCHLPASMATGPAALAVGSVLGCLAAAGMHRRLRSDFTDPGSLLLLGAFGMHGVWAWQYERYMAVLLPWLLWAMAMFLRERADAVLAVLLSTQLLFHGRLFLGPSSRSAPELGRTYAWISRSGQAPMGLLASPMYVRDGWYASRPSIPLPVEETAEGFAAGLRSRRAGLVLWQSSLDIGVSLDESANLRRSLEAAGRHLDDPRFFTLVFEDPAEGSRVYALR